MPRKLKCECGACRTCESRVRERNRYQRMTIEERRAWVQKRDLEKVRARDRERAKRPERRAYSYANTARWRRDHPERVAAHNAVARAVRTGELHKPTTCEIGSCDRPDIHGHHDDYTKPLEVRWLCPEHHAVETQKGTNA